MEVGQDASAVVAAAQGLGPATPAGRAADDGDAGAQVVPGLAVAEAAKSLSAPSAPLSTETLETTLAAQAADEAPAAAGGDAAPGRSGETPAAAARALIADDPGLAELPFGQVVSALARGLDPAPSGDGGDGSDAAALDDVPGTEPIGGVAADDGGVAGDESGTPDAGEQDGAAASQAAIEVGETLAEQLLETLFGNDDDATA